MATTIELDPKNDLLLEQLAEKVGATKEEILRQLIDIAVEELEHFYAAANIAERVHTGEDKVISSEQIRADLGLEG